MRAACLLWMRECVASLSEAPVFAVEASYAPGVRADRELFAAFLERLATGEADREQWERLVVNHYLDETLERIRRDCVRIRIGNEAMRWSAEEQSRIHDWIRELRTAAE